MARNYNYTNLTPGKDFTLEIASDGLTADIIGQGYIKQGDYITISDKYRVDEVEYYSEPPDIWRAKVSLVPQDLRQTEESKAHFISPVTKVLPLVASVGLRFKPLWKSIYKRRQN